MRRAALLLLAVAPAFAAGESYRVVIKFGSVCCGPDLKAMDRVREVIVSESQRAGRALGEKKVHWGHEGESNLCLSLQGLDAGRQAEIVGRLKAAVEKGNTVKLVENAACREGW